jgi:hypothetical protein
VVCPGELGFDGGVGFSIMVVAPMTKVVDMIGLGEGVGVWIIVTFPGEEVTTTGGDEGSARSRSTSTSGYRPVFIATDSFHV